MAKNKNLKMFGLVAAGIGGLVHVLQPLGFNLLGFFGGLAPWVQLGIGAASVWYVVWMWMKRK